MKTQTEGSRYIVFFPPSPDHLEAIDNSLSERIKAEIKKFNQSWNATDVFDKEVTEDVDYIKRKRGDTRAFATYWCNPAESVHVLFVLAVFKQNDKDDYWKEKRTYQSKAEDYCAEFSKKARNGDLESHISNLEADDDYIVIRED